MIRFMLSVTEPAMRLGATFVILAALVPLGAQAQTADQIAAVRAAMRANQGAASGAAGLTGGNSGIGGAGSSLSGDLAAAQIGLPPAGDLTVGGGRALQSGASDFTRSLGPRDLTRVAPDIGLPGATALGQSLGLGSALAAAAGGGSGRPSANVIILSPTTPERSLQIPGEGGNDIGRLLGGGGGSDNPLNALR